MERGVYIQVGETAPLLLQEVPIGEFEPTAVRSLDVLLNESSPEVGDRIDQQHRTTACGLFDALAQIHEGARSRQDELNAGFLETWQHPVRSCLGVEERDGLVCIGKPQLSHVL